MSVAGCTGKVRHTYATAEYAAKRARRRWHTPLRAYRCRLCRGWHVGSGL